MAKDDLLNDEYVAGLLVKDAKESSIKYSAVGLEAFSSPSRVSANKPKPNTRFLRNIIKDTDNHNAALLAKEAAESRARLLSLGGRDGQSSRVGGGDIRRRQLGDIAAILGGRSSKHNRDARLEVNDRRRLISSSEEEEPKPKRSTKLGDGKRHDHRRGEGREEKQSSGKEAVDEGHRSKEHRSHHRRRLRHDVEDGDRKRRRRSNSRDQGRDKEGRKRHRSRSSDHRSKESRRRSRSPQREQKGSPNKKRRHRSRDELNRETKPDYDSDPLDDVIGPRPPPIPEVRSRGRGAMSLGSGIDSRFSAGYDPTVDVQLDPDEENDWDQALEALRDRQKWKQQGADRLRAAGFTEEEIEKWEKGGEKREEDVRWSKKGEGREWDRGKVVGDDSVVSTGASWGRSNDDDELVSAESSWGRLKGTERSGPQEFTSVAPACSDWLRYPHVSPNTSPQLRNPGVSTTTHSKLTPFLRIQALLKFLLASITRPFLTPTTNISTSPQPENEPKFLTPKTAKWAVSLDSAQYASLLKGFSPDSMEDRWSIQAEDSEGGKKSVVFCRSWTGNAVVEIEIAPRKDGSAVITRVQWEENTERVGGQDEEEAKETVRNLCKGLLEIEFNE